MARALKFALFTLVAAGLSQLTVVAGQSPAMRGFTSDALQTQRALEERFRAVPEAARLREYMKTMAAEPHVAGRPGSKVVADYALAQFKSFGLNAAIEEFEAYMPWPTERRLEMVGPAGRTFVIQEPPVPGDPDSTDNDQTPTFNAYSADGDVTGEVVYVNYGVPADYEQLEKLGVSVKGKIVLARYGGSWRGIKPKVAFEHGAIGCLIYSDPKDDGFFQGEVCPDGPYRPEFGVQRGSVMDMPVHTDDPISGAVSLMEVGRGLGELLKTGWRPKRTIVLALWDREEWGLLGSTEWAEAHRDELNGKGVVYINTDGNGKGWMNAGGSHSLQQFISEVARDVNDPRTGTPVLEVARAKAIEALPEAERAEAAKDPNIRIAPLGSGSDFTPFLQHLTLASLNLGFGGEAPGGVYHSVYDSFEWYTTWSDGDFAYGRTLAQVTGTAVLRLSEAAVLPFRFTDMSDTLARYVAEVQKLHAGKKDAPAIDFAPLTAAVAALSKASLGFEKAQAVVPAASAKALQTQEEALKIVNQLVFSSERRMGNEAGLPRRDWFRHQIYAPGYYTGYGVKTLPQIREGLEEGQWDEARQGVTKVAEAIGALAAQVDRASAGLSRVGR